MRRREKFLLSKKFNPIQLKMKFLIFFAFAIQAILGDGSGFSYNDEDSNGKLTLI